MARPRGSGNGVTGATKPSYFQTFQNKMETVRLSRPTWRRRDLKKNFQGFLDHGGYSATQETARLQRQRRDRLASATKMCTFKTFATKVETARLCRPKRRRRDFSDQGGDGATFQTEVETARPRNHSSLPRRRRRDFPDQAGDFPDQAGENCSFKVLFDNPGWAIDQSVFSNQILEELLRALF